MGFRYFRSEMPRKPNEGQQVLVSLGSDWMLATFKKGEFYIGQFPVSGKVSYRTLPPAKRETSQRKPHKGKSQGPLIRMDSSNGASLTDVYERDFRDMEAKGEL